MSQFREATLISSEAKRAPQGSKGDSTLISISTRFNLESPDIQDSDLVLVATDNVYFYAHKSILLLESSNRFGSLIPLSEDEAESQDGGSLPPVPSGFSGAHTFITTDYASDVLNVVLHAIYKFAVEGYRPSPTTLRAATHALSFLGYDLGYIYAPHSELFMLFLQAGVPEPLEMYALAAQYALEDVAVAVSTFTLGVSPSEITDELAVQMGPIYLRRLFFLHLGRADALKRLLYPPPAPHPASPDPHCGPETQSAVSRIWALALPKMSAELAGASHDPNQRLGFDKMYYLEVILMYKRLDVARNINLQSPPNRLGQSTQIGLVNRFAQRANQVAK